ncbi:MAG: DUF429 domain-containing protein [Anaerolinea sp.]|nr:DUF429 domain-containing protein [Anaerolinea sp.]
MTVFIGLDLAWTPHRETGVCVLEGGAAGVALRALNCSISSPEDFARLCGSSGDDVVVAVDAPLVVEPERRAEAELGKVFGSRHAGAYTATMPFLEKMKGLAGPHLAAHLGNRGFEMDPYRLAAEARGRFALEVFPHPAHIELFGLGLALKYKKGPVATRRRVLREYQGHLTRLLARELLRVTTAASVQEALVPEATHAKGKALKNLEDRLDALTCAYVAYHCWMHGPAGFSVFGCREHGCIVVPNRVAVS